MNQRVAFLRGINVGGHHKVPMAELRTTFEKLGCKNVATILNSGNVLFESHKLLTDAEISAWLQATFGFPTPTITLDFDQILDFHNQDPFKGIEVTKDIRLYLTFLGENDKECLSLPWESEDRSFKVLKLDVQTLFSVLDLSLSSTPKAMEVLEKTCGKDITTRNWNTIGRVVKKAAALGWV